MDVRRAYFLASRGCWNKHVLNESELRELFSVIPEAEARRAQVELREQLSSHLKDGETRVVWADFDVRMKTVGAGMVDITGLSSVRINVSAEPSEQSAEFIELVSLAENGEVRVGEIFPSELKDRFLWFVPVVPSPYATHSDVAMRGISVSYDVLSQLVSTFNPDARLTAAESRTVAQIVAGQSIAESAASDGLQPETRRGQLKRAFAKLSVSGQSALVRMILSQAIQLLFIIDEEMRVSLGLSELVAAHLPKNVRVQLRRITNGPPLRILEVGDPSGRPILIVHGLFFVPLLQSLAECDWLKGLRFVMPLREGYMATQQGAQQLDTNDERDIHNLRILLDSFKNEAPILLGHSMGCVSAIQFSNRYPDLIAGLILASPFFGRPAEGRAVYLSRIMKVVSRFGRDGVFYRIIAAQFAKRYSKPKNAQAALERVFGHSKKDSRLLAGDAGLPLFMSWFGQVFRDSVDGIAGDFRRLVNFEISEISGLKEGSTVFIGNDDPLIEEYALVKLRDSCEHRVFTVEGAGHFAAMTDVGELREVIEAALA